MLPTHDLFLSYRTHHAARVAPLIEALARHGVRIWLDVDQIRGGESITEALRRALASSRTLAVYATDDYANSMICAWELATAWIAAERQGQEHQRVLLLRPPESGDRGRVGLGPLLDSRAFDLPYGDLDGVAHHIAEHLAACDSSTFGELLDVEVAPRWLPFARSGSNHFVGRLGALWDLHAKLVRTRQVGVTGHVGPVTAQVRGLAGNGKTLLTIEYTRRFAAAWPGGIFWFDADAGWSVDGEQPMLLARRNNLLAQLAGPLGSQIFPGDLAATAHGVETALREQTAGRPYLWIFDNVPPGTTQRTLDALRPPDDHAAFLFTTRWRALGSLGEHVDLDVLDPDAAYMLLTGDSPPRDPTEEAAARRVARAVGHHPLALDVLRALLPATAAFAPPYATWDRRLADQSGDALDDAARTLAEELPTGCARAVSIVFAGSLEGRSELALEILHLAAVLADEPIPGSLIAEVLAEGNEGRRLQVESAVAELAVQSLVTLHRNVPGIHVHTLVRRTAMRWRCDRPQLDALAARACEVFSRRFKSTEYVDHRTHASLLPLLPHALVLADSPMIPAALLGVHIGNLLQERGDFVGARLQFERAFTTLERLHGPEHPDTLGTLQNLAGSLGKLGDFTGSRTRYEQALTAQRRVLGPEHRDTLRTQQNLALTVEALGDLKHARKLLGDAHAAAERGFGPEDGDSLTILINLAIVLRAQGDLGGARAILERVNGENRRIHGSDDRRTLAPLGNLAVILAAQGDIVGARACYERVLVADQRDKGTNHPDTLRTLQNLAGTLHEQGDLAGARARYEEVFEARVRLLGADHPDTLMTQHNLAVTLEAQGELAGAREHVTRALSGMQRRLGLEHQQTLAVRQTLAVILKAQGNFGDARQHEEYLFSALEKRLGAEHPWTLTAANNLAITWAAQGELPRARELYERVMSARQRLLGAEHPDTLSTLQNLAGTLYKQGEIASAVDWYTRALNGRERVLGPDHSDTTVTRYNLAIALYQVDPVKAVPHVLRLRRLLDRPVESLSANERFIADVLSRSKNFTRGLTP